MTDSRLADAQERAAELVKRNRELDKPYSTALAGWAEAVAALAEIVPMLELRESLENRCFTCGADEHHAHSPTCVMDNIRTAITKFCDAMLGENDG